MLQVKTARHKGHILYDFTYVQGLEQQAQRNKGYASDAGCSGEGKRGVAASGTGFPSRGLKCFEIRKWRCTHQHCESIKKLLNCTFKKVNFTAWKLYLTKSGFKKFLVNYIMSKPGKKANEFLITFTVFEPLTKRPICSYP